MFLKFFHVGMRHPATQGKQQELVSLVYLLRFVYDPPSLLALGHFTCQYSQSLALSGPGVFLEKMGWVLGSLRITMFIPVS